MEIYNDSKKFRVFGCIIISSLAAASCLTSLFGDFVFDDTEVILNNEDVLPETPINNIWLHDYWGSNIRSNLSHKSYRPLTILTFRLNYILSGGLKPFSFHLVNVILHVFISVLNWNVFGKFLGKGRDETAFYAAILFSVHPIHTEAVCGIVGRADLLAALFFLLSFLTYSKAIEKQHTKWASVFFSILLAAISMFCKEQGITVLGILIMYDLLSNGKIEVNKIWRLWSCFQLKRKSSTSFIIRQCLIVLSAFLLILLRYYLMGFESPPFQILDNPASFEKEWLTRVVSYNYIFFLNIWLLLCPEWLCFDWSMGCIPVLGYLDKRLVFVLLFWTGLGFVIWKALSMKSWRRQRDILLSVSLIVIPFLPASNLFFKVGFVLAERVLYIPSAGFCLLVVCGMEILQKNCPANKKFSEWLNVGLPGYIYICYLRKGSLKKLWTNRNRYRKKIYDYKFMQTDIKMGYFLLIIVFLTRSSERSSDWLSEKALFDSGLSVCPLNAKVHYNVAIAALASGNVTKAISEYKEAIRLYPDYYQAFNNLANVLKNEGKLDEAEVLLRKALDINEEFPAAWMNLGVVLAQKKQYKDAEGSYFKALKYRKKYPDCYYNLGKLYLEDNRLEEAERSWRIAIKLKPSFTVAWNNLIILTSNRGNHSRAVTIGEEALALLGDEPSIHFNMANALGKLGEFPESEKHFIKAIQLKPDNPQFLVNLGVLYHRWKKYRRAEEYYKRALKLQPNFKAAIDNYNLLKKVFEKEGMQNA